MTTQNVTTGNSKLILLLFTSSILTPFIGTIFFIRTTSAFILLPVYLVAFIVLIVSSVKLTRSMRFKRMWVIMIVTGTVILFFISYGIQLQLADTVYFKIRERQLRKFVLDIKAYGKISEMSDGKRCWKSVNNVSIESDMTNIDTIGNSLGGQKYFLDDVLNEKGIDKKIYEVFQQKLIKTGFISFSTLKDGSISFTMDGMLDNCYGLSYSETGRRPQFNDCGEIVRWVKVSENWYSWGTT